MKMRDNLKIVNALAVHKLKLQYYEQIFGFAWAIITPLIYIVCYAFFYSYGLRGSSLIEGTPYILWLFPGVIIFRYLLSCLRMAPRVLDMNKDIMSTGKYNVFNIALIEVLKEFYVHIVVLIVFSFIFSGISYVLVGDTSYLPSVYYINFLFYMPMVLLYVYSITIPLSILGVLLKDTKDMVNAFSQPLFWITPVGFYCSPVVSPLLDKIEKLFNPLYYFVIAYRDTMVGKVFFWEHSVYHLYMLIIITCNLLIGLFLYKKAKYYLLDFMS